MNNQLQTKLLAAFPNAYISSHTSTDWSSMFFKGERQQICLGFASEAETFAAWFADYSGHDFDYDTFKVCDVQATELDRERRFVTLEFITLNE